MRQASAMSWADARVSRVGEMESQVQEMGAVVCARHLIPAGFDSTPYYRGLPDDMCPCEHWCYLARGRLRYRFADGDVLEVDAGDAFHIRASHLADVLEDAELIEFTRSDDHRRKAEHLERESRRDAGGPLSDPQLMRQIDDLSTTDGAAER